MMIFKGRAHTENGKYSDLALGIAYSPNIEGPYTVLNNEQPIFQMDGQGEAEDPFLWKDSKGYHAIFKDHVAKYTGERDGGVMAHSTDGVHRYRSKGLLTHRRMGRWKSGNAGTIGTPVPSL